MNNSEIDHLKDLAKIQCDPYDKKFPNWQPITIGKSIVCDGYYKDDKSPKTTAVFSHFHEDHIHNINKTLTNCDNILLTQPTYDALIGMKKIDERGTFKILSEGKSFHTNFNEKIELIDANHVPGSSQVLVTMTENDEKILYSGDFSYPGITVPKADVLILEAEHGESIYDFETNRPLVFGAIFEQVIKELENDRPVEIRAHQGTMQEIMAYLEKTIDGNSIHPDVPFLADQKSVDLTHSLNYYYKNNIREVDLATSERLNELFHDEKQAYLRFAKVGTQTLQEDRGIVIQADANQGYKQHGPFFTLDNHRFFACTAAHSSFTNVMKYVHAVQPKLVIVDGTRASTSIAKELCLSIADQEHILALPQYCSYD